jgi:predicted secreted Zn-dependent protease
LVIFEFSLAKTAFHISVGVELMHLKLIAIVLSILIFTPLLFAQQPSESLGDAARKAREAKERRASATTTITSDSISPSKPAGAVNRAAAQPSAPLPYELKTVPKYWPTCAAAIAEMNGEKPTGHTDQEFDAKLAGISSRSNDIWTFSGTPTVKNSLTVNLPEWVNIPDDPAIRAAWQKMIDALRKHEEGHVTIALEALQPLIGRTITGSGPSQVSAQEDAQRQLDQLTHMIDSSTRARQDQYDALTDHGRKQSALGGTDVTFTCR